MPAMQADETNRNAAAETLDSLTAARVVGVLRAPGAKRALALAEPAIAAGLKAVEVTFTVPDAAEVIAELRAGRKDVVIGAGTVLSATQADAAIAAGAAFLVSPHFEAAVHEVALASGVPYVPGALTPSEVYAASQAVGGLVKVFPVARLGGGKYVADLLAPYPDLQLMVTGGVSLSSVGEYIDAGAKAVGIGSVFDMEPDELRSGLLGI